MVFLRSYRLAGLGLLALALSGCMDDLLVDDKLTWVWGVAPCVGFAVAAIFLVRLSRLTELRAWRLDRFPSLPAAGGFYAKGAGVWIVTVALFLVLNATTHLHDSRQVFLNVGFWSIGALAGILFGAFIGIRQAERSYAAQILSRRF